MEASPETTKPVKSFEELLLWHRNDYLYAIVCNLAIPIDFKDGNRKAPDLVKRSPAVSGKAWKDSGYKLESLEEHLETVPRTLYCHDLKGGYLEDRFEGPVMCQQMPFTFTHWSCVDTFVYFSHNFITIPPLGWIEAGHRNGVQVLGTIITEWDEGAKICTKILANQVSMDRFTEKVIDIMISYNFDGWLFNIENTLEEIEVARMVMLLEAVNKKAKAVNPKATILWYDSVTKEGKLDWQNELNELNLDFFNVCDGIFLNYTWKPENLDLSKAKADSFGRPLDVYVGIDVFGRGCVGGGGFNCDIAMKEIRDRAMSVALFAPSWTYECAEDKGRRDFWTRELRFWQTLESYMFFRGPKVSCLDRWQQQQQQEIGVCLFHSGFGTGCRAKGSMSLMMMEQKGQEQRLKGQSPKEADINAKEQLDQSDGADSDQWWLDLTRAEFQSTFPYRHHPGQEKAVVVGGDSTIGHDYTVFPEKTEGLCIQAKARGGDVEPFEVPLFACLIQVQPNGKRQQLTFDLEFSKELVNADLIVILKGPAKLQVPPVKYKGGKNEYHLNTDSRDIVALGLLLSPDCDYNVTLKSFSVYLSG